MADRWHDDDGQVMNPSLRPGLVAHASTEEARKDKHFPASAVTDSSAVFLQGIRSRKTTCHSVCTLELAQAVDCQELAECPSACPALRTAGRGQ